MKLQETLEHISKLINNSFENETFELKNEIKELKEQVSKLTEALRLKDEQCRHIASVLQSKNEEWKRIKLKLAANRKVYDYKNEEGMAGIGKNEEEENFKCREESYESDENCNNAINTINMVNMVNTNYAADINSFKANSNIYSSSHNNDTTISTNVSVDAGNTDHLDDCTQLPPTETQSNLDALIDLITDEEVENVCEIKTSKEKENLFVNNGSEMAGNRNISGIYKSNGLMIDTRRSLKRKSHSKGCSCCDKFYSATRSPNAPSVPASDTFTTSPNTPPGFWDTSFTPRQ